MALERVQWSRFNNTPTVMFRDEEVYGVWKRPAILGAEIANSELVVVRIDSELAGKPHKIAEVVYGTSLLDWLVIAYNNATSMFGWPKAGDIITLPPKSMVFSELA